MFNKVSLLSMLNVMCLVPSHLSVSSVCEACSNGGFMYVIDSAVVDTVREKLMSFQEIRGE